MIKTMTDKIERFATAHDSYCTARKSGAKIDKEERYMKTMNIYEVEVTNTTASNEWLETLTAERPCMTPELMRSAIASLFFRSADLGCLGEHLQATIKTGDNLVCTISCDSFMDGSCVYADIAVGRPEEEAVFLRRMTIAD